MTEKQWHEVIDVNLTGVWHTAKAAIPALIEQGEGGSIILTSSVAGLFGQPFSVSYTASKHGVVGIGRCLANELAEYGIRVNSVHPTGVETEMGHAPDFASIVESKASTLGPMFMNSLPMTMVEPEDVAAVVAFLASDEARTMTGGQVRVDGGKLNR